MRWPKKPAKVCPSHGGHAPQVIKKATERRVEEQIRQMADMYVPGSEPIADPLTALLDVAGEIKSFKDFLGERVAEMRADQWRYSGEHAEQVRAELSLYERALDRTAKVLVDISKLGIEERQVRLAGQIARSQGDLITLVLNRIFDRLELTPGQRTLIGVVVPQELRRAADEEA